MAVEFKPGDIVITVPSLYTTALVVSVQPSVMHPGTFFAKVIPMFGTFPIGKFLYEAEFPGQWQTLSPAHYLISLPEAKRALKEAFDKRAVDNLTYIELLNILNERSQS